jgi:protoporphyrinogen oxidase
MEPAVGNDKSPIRIVGGGMTGLTLALRLAQKGIPVVVHERDPYLGGLTSESELGGVPIERFYHCLLPTDTALLDLFSEIGLGASVGWNRVRTGFYTGKALLDMTTTFDFLRFPALNLIDRMRLAWTIAYCGVIRSWEKLDNEPIGPFLRRHGGDRLFESIWEPLLIAKLGVDYDRFAASFIWATVYRMLSARKAKGRSEKLGFVRGRYGKVFASLRVAIKSHGGDRKSVV